MAALLLDHVTKDFGARRAVDGVSFAVGAGEVFGFLGGNGAGKTTTLRMVLDILRPSSGSIAVLGRPPGRENNARLGFLPEERGLYRTMSAIDVVTYFARLKGMARGPARAQARSLLDRFDLSHVASVRTDKLSKGTAQKVQLAAAIVHDPELLILDEPFSGLDPVNQALLEGEIRALARRGVTILFSTHVMQHAERLCDRLLLLSSGRKLFEGTQDAARALLPPRLTLSARSTPAGLLGVTAVTARACVDGWTDWDVRLAAGHDPADLLHACTEQGFVLRRFDRRQPSLHDVFLHVVGGAEDGR